MHDTVEASRPRSVSPDPWSRSSIIRGLIAVVFALIGGALSYEFEREDSAGPQSVAANPLYDAMGQSVGDYARVSAKLVREALNRHIGDLATALGSPRAKAQRTDIAIVQITEETLIDHESRSPIDRRLLAELVRAVDLAEPALIALNLVFDRRTASDGELIKALREARSPVVLAALDGRELRRPEGLAIQSEILSAIGRPRGHVILATKRRDITDIESIVRAIAPPMSTDLPAFVDQIAAVAGVAHRPANGTISWLRQPDPQTFVFATLQVPRVKPSEVRPALDGVFLPSWREQLKGRVVLLGAELQDTVKAVTPLSYVDGARMSGTQVQAQALAQRFGGNRDIRETSGLATFLMATLTTLICFQIARMTGVNPQGVAYGITGLLLIAALSIYAFDQFRLELPAIALTSAWAIGGFGGLIGGAIYRHIGVHE